MKVGSWSAWFLAVTVIGCSRPEEPANARAAERATQDGALYRRALELEAAGRLVEAAAEVERAIAAGAGRDARLLATKLAILREDWDAAAPHLEHLLQENPRDADAQYNLGLVAQRRGSFNKARAAYLAALRADPSYAPARYNLAVLTWDAGARDEARHHAQKFLELAPGDPRAAELRRKVELDAVPAPAGGS